jgi:hypothetical protein
MLSATDDLGDAVTHPQTSTPHHVAQGNEQRGDGWFLHCQICGVGIVNKQRDGDSTRTFVGHDGRPDLDVEAAEPGSPTTPIGLVYCCATLGWVPPSIAFDHHWDTSRPLDGYVSERASAWDDRP